MRAGCARIRLPDAVNADMAAALQRVTVRVLACSGDVVVLCAETRHIAAAGLQILAALALRLERTGRRVVLDSVGPEMAATLDRCGLTRFFTLRG
jgi:anti-anti-sigma factor